MILFCLSCGRILVLKKKDLYLVKCHCGEVLVCDGEILLKKTKILGRKPRTRFPVIPEELLFNPQARFEYFVKRYGKEK